MADIHLAETSNASPKVKPKPFQGKIPVPCTYYESDDGTDENLLIILHGLGDTHAPFARMAKQLKLPQTAVLALRAPQQIPFMDMESYQWYTSFDPLGELVPNPDPTPALDLLTRVVDYLTAECAWAPHQLHFFGFAQGGSVAAEFALRWWQAHSSDDAGRLGSLVSVSGPLLSYPTISPPSPTPVLVVHRPATADPSFPKDALAAYRKGFREVREELIGRGSTRQGMPASRDEWEPIMRFWSERLGRRQGEGLYEVLTGRGAA
ncbi:Alpha/Beta hydrolase protein [Schizophyllum fasciatum]